MPANLWARMAAVGTAAALLVTACAPDDAELEPDATPTEESPDPDRTSEPDEGSGSETSPEAEEEEDEQAEPDVVADEDGFLRANTLPDPVAEQLIELPVEGSDELASAKVQAVSLDSDGDFARLVIAWLPPEDGEALTNDLTAAFRARAQATPYLRLVDRGASELIEPLYAESRQFRNNGGGDESAPSPETLSVSDGLNKMQDVCVCTGVSSSSNDGFTHLLYLDFPAPESGEVDILLSEALEPLRDVPVSSGEPFEMPDDDLSRFTPRDHEMAEQYGAGAVAERRVPLASRSEALTGLTTTEEGETREVSLPADVLFEFGEYSLTGDAESIIEDAAEKLNEEASGQTVTVEGHTDNVSGHDINQPLSENRAEAVAEAIEPLLDGDITIETEGHSFDRPLVPNEDADGNELPENQALNRRVSFRYTVVEESEVQIDLGYEELDDLQEAEETDAADGALASYILPAPEEDNSEYDIRLDVLEAENSGDSVTLHLGLGLSEGDYDPNALPGSRAAEDPQLFGKNPYSTNVDPGMGNIGLVDLGSEQQHFPTTGGPLHCLCSEVAPFGQALSEQGTAVYAEFRLSESIEGPLVLRIPDSAQIELPEDVVEQISG